jgi:outer membrane protein OmpA-like peptidoglycan-associated protein
MEVEEVSQRANRSLRALSIVILVLLAATSAGQVNAGGGQKGDWEIGLFAGYAFLDTYESRTTPALRPDDELLWGARFGAFLDSRWSLETSYQRLDTETDFSVPSANLDVQVDSVRLNVLYNFNPDSSFRPFFTFGAGWEFTEADTLFDIDDPSYNLGFGLRWFLGRTFGLRLDGKYVHVDTGEPLLDSQANVEATFGLLWAFGGGPPPDEDGDGVKDKKDRCPGTPRGAVVDENGCPRDGDGDGVPDGIDRCPDTPAGYAVDASGCPVDSDGDGVNDALDRCPNTPKGAVVDEQGCPVDSDGDGVPDGLDRCPGTPAGAVVDAQGCPVDSDGDGVPDGIDRCPDTPRGAVVDDRGCPVDSDGDGVPDGIDQCPGTPPGTRVNAMGCAVLFDEGQETLVLRDVNFETDSAKLTPESEAFLQSVALSLTRVATDVQVEVAGHTDSTGSEGHNLRLSQRRADAVRTFLIGQGVPGTRLQAKGYGESEPVDDNRTEAGRAKNRRVELRRLN